MNARFAKLSALFVLALIVSLASPLPGRAGHDDPPDLVGTPDLIVDQSKLRQHWIVRVEDFVAGDCAVEEGEITPGEHTIVRFTVSTPNIGDADLFVGDPNEHYQNNDGLFELATCHGHFHFRHYALYELIDPASGFVWRAAKRGFCMIDIEKYGDYPGSNNNDYKFRSCGAVGVPGFQGISKGWSDVYWWKLAGQFFVLDGGDGQALVPPGEYLIRITVNPGFVPQGGEPCRYADPLHPGVCHQLPESNYENNVAEIRLTIPDHPGREGVGPLKDQASTETAAK
jgi:hypothetical protein